jgi:hypothetical protein
VLRDRFTDGDMSGWIPEDEGSQNRPSHWTIFQGVLRQTSNIFTPLSRSDPLSSRGTQVVAGDRNWADVVVRVNLESPTGSTMGMLFRYRDKDDYYRFSMDSQRGYRRLVKNVGGTFTLLWGDTIAYEVGRSHELTVVALGSSLRGYMNGVPLFVVEDSSLTAGSLGFYCWANTDARFSQVRVYPTAYVFDAWLLNESFDLLTPGRWSFVNEGDQAGPSKWEVIQGELRQASLISGGSNDRSELAKPGTYALAGNPSWSDYRLTVRLRSDTDKAIGVMFRYMDANNYYRFSMDRERTYRRLIKKVAGVVSLLWEDTVQYTVEREYILTLDCLGDRLTGYLDGVQVFSKKDGTLTSGRIGLYCWANNAARFAEVQVAAPLWRPYYTFGREMRMPAGARVRIYAGHETETHAEDPGVLKRFIASPGEQAQLLLPAEGADLRILSPDDNTGHTRYFLPPSDYTPVAARVLRKADGTSFCVLPPAATPSVLAPGQYRLNLTFRRDNQASGVSDPEQLTIDIPWVAH